RELRIRVPRVVCRKPNRGPVGDWQTRPATISHEYLLRLVGLLPDPNQAPGPRPYPNEGETSLRHKTVGGWRHQAQVDQLKSEAGDPLQESLEAALVWQLG